MTKLSGPMLLPASGTQPKQAVVLLHGYGSDGNDLIGLVPYWRDTLPDALFVAPNGPAPCDGFGEGYQWFEVDFAGDRLASRQTGVLQARPILEQFFNDMWAQTGILPQDTLLVGFSQGAMMALHVGLALPQSLMGIVAFAGALLPPEGFGTASAGKPPICLVHGDADTVVDPERSADAAQALEAAGYDVAYHVSPGAGHTIAPDGLEFASTFIARVAAK
ncbi:alpha/beta hydrolase [Devosia beringensis]|uniref:alpha/beta hydrolase n=1 Tax=Devosia beringensis TaxID=2657486 RepID=UPI00186B663C|nr:prolyl oligopeptidase family serine peptidase [Devosia beringensis]